MQERRSRDQTSSNSKGELRMSTCAVLLGTCTRDYVAAARTQQPIRRLVLVVLSSPAAGTPTVLRATARLLRVFEDKPRWPSPWCHGTAGWLRREHSIARRVVDSIWDWWFRGRAAFTRG